MGDPFQFAFSGPTRVIFGDGVIAETGKHLPFADRLLVVTGRTSAVRTGHLDRLLGALAGKKVTVFRGVSPNPRLTEVESAAEEGRSAGVEAVIGFGGGSTLDAAKAIAAAIGGADVEECLREDRPAPDTTLPIVCIPTTAGTGSETSQAAILSDEKRGLKQGLRGVRLAPRLAVVDPALLATLPEHVAAETGFDVLTHALESWVSRRASALTIVNSRHAITAVLRHLPAFISDRENPEPRREMSLASLMMGWNLANSSTALPHRLQYPVGAHTDTSHPAGLAALYPAWTQRAVVAAPEPFRFIAGLAGADTPSRGRDCLMEFLRRTGMVRRLRDFGLSHADCPVLVRQVSGNLTTDPCDSSPPALQQIYEESV